MTGKSDWHFAGDNIMHTTKQRLAAIGCGELVEPDEESGEQGKDTVLKNVFSKV